MFLLAAFGAPYLLCIRDGSDGSAAADDGGMASIVRTVVAAVALELCGCGSFCAILSSILPGGEK